MQLCEESWVLKNWCFWTVVLEKTLESPLDCKLIKAIHPKGNQSWQWTPRTDLLQYGLVGSPCSPRDSQESSPTPQFESINSLAHSFHYSPTLTSIHGYWKTIALTRWTFVIKVTSLLFHMLFRLVIAFLPRSECLLISWLQSPSAVILELQKNSLSLFPLFPHLYWPGCDGTRCHDLRFLNV